MATERKVSAMVCFETVQKVVGKHIVNANGFDEKKVTLMAALMK
jgi:hypothetical protein